MIITFLHNYIILHDVNYLLNFNTSTNTSTNTKDDDENSYR